MWCFTSFSDCSYVFLVSKNLAITNILLVHVQIETGRNLCVDQRNVTEPKNSLRFENSPERPKRSLFPVTCCKIAVWLLSCWRVRKMQKTKATTVILSQAWLEMLSLSLTTFFYLLFDFNSFLHNFFLSTH